VGSAVLVELVELVELGAKALKGRSSHGKLPRNYPWPASTNYLMDCNRHCRM